MPLAGGQTCKTTVVLPRNGINTPRHLRSTKTSFSLHHRDRPTSASCSAESPGYAQQEAETAEPAGLGKSNLEPVKQIRAEFGVSSVPHPEKASYGGEDAYFTSPVGGGAFGVADGVGGWQESGINPAEYSRTFMRLACAFLEGKKVGKTSVGELPQNTSANGSLLDTPPSSEAETAEALTRLTPQAALQAAHEGTRLPGSTTACIVRLDRPRNMLTAANVGDSGFLILRAGSVSFRSPPLQHFFDCPLQFAAYPDFTNATDSAEDAGLYELPVQEGDQVVAGTDGLWDNVHQEEIVEIMQRHSDNMQQAAEELARAASEHANDKKFPSPYTQEARKQGIDIPWILRIANASFADGKFKLGHMKGGKLDDITVITAVLKSDGSIPPTSDSGLEPAQAATAAV